MIPHFPSESLSSSSAQLSLPGASTAELSGQSRPDTLHEQSFACGPCYKNSCKDCSQLPCVIQATAAAAANLDASRNAESMTEVTSMFKRMMENMQDVKQSVSDVKSEVSEMRGNMVNRTEFNAFKTDVENRFASVSTTTGEPVAFQGLRNQIERQARALDKLDVAHKSICFSGFSSDTPASTRLSEIEKFMTEHFADTVICKIESLSTGTAGNRTLTKKTIMELQSQQARNHILTQVKSRNLIFNCNSQNITADKAKTQKQLQRNSSMFQALDKVKAHSEAIGKECKIEWKIDGSWDRNITVAGQIAFVQHAGEATGLFKGSFANLTF